MCVEWVAGSPWNQWPDVHGIGGRMAVESAPEQSDDAPATGWLLEEYATDIEVLVKTGALADWMRTAWAG